MNISKVSGMSVNDFIAAAFAEDIGSGDHTSLSCIQPDAKATAIVKVKSSGVIAGLVLADQILNFADSTIKVKVLANDGDAVKAGDVVMEIEGNVQSMLKVERLLLNCMQRMSGIATLTRQFVNEVSGSDAKILDTRKTTPNFRMFEKWAVKIGGGENHRFGLYDMILIKDNHVDAAGGIENAITRACNYLLEKRMNLPVEIETRNLKEVQQVLNIGKVSRIMLDNFSFGDLRAAVLLINKKFETEASGGITLENVKQYAACGVDFISVGALTHSYTSMDISMKIANG